MIPRGLLGLTCILALLASASCDDGSEPKGAGAPAATTSAEKTARKDRGSASASIGGEPWAASRASARATGDQLHISASKTEMVDGKTQSEQLTLVLPGFDGPGDYVTGSLASTFVGVAIDTRRAKEAKSDAEVARKAMGAIAGSRMLMLSNAKVAISSVTDETIEGTFEWTPPEGSGDPAITDGKFRALVRK